MRFVMALDDELRLGKGVSMVTARRDSSRCNSSHSSLLEGCCPRSSVSLFDAFNCSSNHFDLSPSASAPSASLASVLSLHGGEVVGDVKSLTYVGT
jgi:hypothetical protein